MLRGVQETQTKSSLNGLLDECEKDYPLDGLSKWNALNDIFNCLPFGALIEEKVYVTKGGLTPDYQSLEDIDNIRRPSRVGSSPYSLSLFAI